MDHEGEHEALLAALLATVRDEVSAPLADAVVAGDLDEVATLAAGLELRATVRALGEAGWIVPDWPEAYGGRGTTAEEAAVVAAALRAWGLPRTPPGSGLPLAAPTILQWSSEDTKRRLLPPLVSGEERWCQLFSEPGAGSDLSSLATTAVRDGDEWIVNGAKVWTTFGHESEMAMLLARTDPSLPKHAGITYFGLDLRAAGVEVRPIVQLTGETEFNEVFLTDVRVPERNRISPLGDGWKATLTTLGAERFALSGTGGGGGGGASAANILGGRPVEDLLALARQHLDRHDPAHRPDRHRVVQAYVDAKVLSWSGRLIGQRVRRGELPADAGSLGKIATAGLNQRLQSLALDLLGPRATAWTDGDDEVAGWLRAFLRTRANSIEGGTSEVQRNIVGERVLGLPREPDPWKGAAWREVPRS